MSRTAAYLAALASTAVPGLDPVSARAVRAGGAPDFDVGFVVDAARRRWTVRAPRTAAAGASQESVVALLGSLASRVPFSVPTPQGFVAVPQGRAMVYPHLDGWPLLLACVPPAPGLAADLGRTIAALHDVDRRVFDEAGTPAYDAASYREHHLAELDRAAATGHVPVPLLQRWQRALDDVTLWRFAPAATHGRLTGRAVLAVFDSEDDASTGHVRALTGWEDAKVADPADDLAAVLDECSPQTADSVLEAYAHARGDRPDPHLRRRALLAAELRRLSDLLAAVTADAADLVRTSADALRQLERTGGDDPIFAPPAAPQPGRPRSVPVDTAPQRPAPASGATAAPGVTQEIEIPEHQLARVRPQPAANPPARTPGVNGASADGTSAGGQRR